MTKYIRLTLFEFLGDEKSVDDLIKNGTHLEERTKAGKTALLLAALNGNFQQNEIKYST